MRHHHPPSTDLAHADITDAILGSFFEAYRDLGQGFHEHVFRRATAILLRERGHDVLEEVPLIVTFRGVVVGSFRADLVVDKTVLVEVKSAPTLEPYMEAQLLNYLKAAGGGVGLVLNFGRTAAFKRAVSGDPWNSLPQLNQSAPSVSRAQKSNDQGTTT